MVISVIQLIENACFVLSNEQVEYHAHTKGPTDLKDGLLAIKAKCDRLLTAYPTHFSVDDCCQSAPTIKSVFPDAIVLQDAKHLINRMVGQLSKSSHAYGAACTMLHGAIMGGKIYVRSRNGENREIDGPLPDPETMIKQLDNCIRHCKALDPDLFKAEFAATVETQKGHIRKVSHYK